jgi:hypothetical protein
MRKLITWFLNEVMQQEALIRSMRNPTNALVKGKRDVTAPEKEHSRP